MDLVEDANDLCLSHVQLAFDSSARPVQIHVLKCILLIKLEFVEDWRLRVIINRKFVNEVPTLIDLRPIPLVFAKRVIIEILAASQIINLNTIIFLNALLLRLLIRF